MLGYLRAEKPGVLEPPLEGWHDTGDIVTIDADGFVAIKGRAKRFAKIGGEMVSLTAVEELCARLWPDEPHAVVAQADPRKGEQLVLLTERESPDRKQLLAHAKAEGASELMIPKTLRHVEKLPVLGTGKIDYVSLAQALADEAGDKGVAAS